MAKERAERCERCRFWFKRPGFDLEEDEGAECRRYPPQLGLAQIAAMVDIPDEKLTLEYIRTVCLVQGENKPLTGSLWPQTMRDDWCGEFQPQEQFSPANGRFDSQQLDSILSTSESSGRIVQAVRRAKFCRMEQISAAATFYLLPDDVKRRYHQAPPPCVGDVLLFSAAELLAQKNFGARSLGELRNALAALGLKLEGDP